MEFYIIDWRLNKAGKSFQREPARSIDDDIRIRIHICKQKGSEWLKENRFFSRSEIPFTLTHIGQSTYNIQIHVHTCPHSSDTLTRATQ